MSDSDHGDDFVAAFPVATSMFDHGTLSQDVDNDALQKMQARIIQLAFALYQHGYIPDAIQVGFTNHDTITFAEQVRKLLVFETLTVRLLQHIIPEILAKTSFAIHHEWPILRDRVESGIDPVKTARINPLALSIGMRYAQYRQKKEFLTPENILVGLTINMLIRDARRILDYISGLDYFSRGERDLITHCLFKCQTLKKRRIPALLCREADRHLREPDNSFEIEKIAIEKIYASVGVRNNGYLKLLEWRKKYLELDITGEVLTDKAPTRSIIDHHGYELLVLMELILILGNMGRVNQLQPLTVEGRRPESPVFECVFSKNEKWDIYYQTAAPVKSGKYVGNLTGIPDMIIKNPLSNRTVLCDAKKYTATAYGGAIFKMLGYLYQFGYPDEFHRIAGGVLFIPEKIGHEPGWTEWTGRSKTLQSINTVTIPVSGTQDHAIRQECIRWVKRTREMLL